MTDLSQLIERVQSATGPDRELDRDICVALGWHQVETNVGLDWRTPCGQSRMIPHLTTSIDAALTLLPEGYDWSLFGDNGGAMAGCMPSSEDWCDMTDTPGATPCLALLAAILKARQTAAQPAKQAEARSSEQSGVRHD